MELGRGGSINNGVTTGYSPAECDHSHLQQNIYLTLLCAKHCFRHYIYITEQNIRRPFSLGACILMGKKPAINKKYDRVS